MKRLLPLILIVALIITTVAAETIENQTSLVTESDVTFTQLEGDISTAAITTRRNEIICVLKLTEPNIKVIESVILPYTTLTTFHSSSPCLQFTQANKLYISNPSLVDSQYQVAASFTGNVIPQNQHLIEYRFSTTYSYSIAMNAVGQPTGIAKKSGDATTEYTDFVERILVIAGDIDNDQIVNATDSLLINQYISGDVTLTESQRIAADVDRNGSIDAGDMLMIQEYAVSNIFTFWDHSTYSTSENPNIDTTKDYRIQNVNMGQYLGTEATVTQGVWVDYPEDIEVCRFKFTYLGNGLYKISWVYDDNIVLCMASDGSLFFREGAGGLYRWYVEGSGSKFRIINYNAKTRWLSLFADGDPGVSYNTYGMYWRIHGPEIPIDTYFDYGYVARYGNGSVNTSKTEISQLIGWINNITLAEVGIAFSENAYGRVESYGDQCLGKNNVNASNVTQACAHVGLKACDANWLCTHILQNQGNSNCTVDCYSQYHHNASDKILHYFMANTARDVGYVSLLFSGYNKCADITGGGSLASGDKCLMMHFTSWDGDRTIDEDKKNAVLHELGHTLGATGDKSCVNTGCIMSYALIPALFLEKVRSGATDFFCSQCTDEIMTQIETDLSNKF